MTELQPQRVRMLLAVLAFGGLLAGCAQTALAPTVQVSPGPGKTIDAFRLDDAACRTSAANDVTGAVGGGVAATSSGGDALATVANALTTASTMAGSQAQYNDSYSSCMVAHGDMLGAAPAMAAAVPVGGPDPAMVRGVQKELIRLNYLHDSADGAAGPRTRSAIRSYEQASNLAVDGAPSDGLLAKLRATPSSAAATGAATAGWVAPAPAAGTPLAVTPVSTAPAPAASGWVAPAQPGAAVTPAVATAPAPAAGWVAPATAQ